MYTQIVQMTNANKSSRQKLIVLPGSGLDKKQWAVQIITSIQEKPKTSAIFPGNRNVSGRMKKYLSILILASTDSHVRGLIPSFV